MLLFLDSTSSRSTRNWRSCVFSLASVRNVWASFLTNDLSYKIQTVVCSENWKSPARVSFLQNACEPSCSHFDSVQVFASWKGRGIFFQSLGNTIKLESGIGCQLVYGVRIVQLVLLTDGQFAHCYPHIDAADQLVANSLEPR